MSTSVLLQFVLTLNFNWLFPLSYGVATFAVFQFVLTQS